MSNILCNLFYQRWQLLFPNDESCESPTQEDFDTTLMFWFLQNFCNCPRPSNRVWQWKPNVEDGSQVANVIQIRDLRNFIVSSTTLALFDEEYQRKIAEISGVIYLQQHVFV